MQLALLDVVHAALALGLLVLATLAMWTICALVEAGWRHARGFRRSRSVDVTYVRPVRETREKQGGGR